MKELVAEVVEGKFKDGQLDECALTIKDLRLISDSFIKTLAGMFHARVEYQVQAKEILTKDKVQYKGKLAPNKNSSNR